MGGYASFLLSLSPALLLSLVFLTLFSGVPIQAEHWIRFLGIVGFSLVYLAVFFTLGMFISTLTRRPATALILGLFIWAIWGLGVPRVGNLMAKSIEPVEPIPTFIKQKRAIRRDVPIAEDQERMWRLDDAYIAKVDGQMEFGQHLSRLSPLASYVYAATTLAQTGIPDALDYRRQIIDWHRRLSREEWAFHWSGPYERLVHRFMSVEESVSKIGVDGGLLLLWIVLLFLCANMMFMRYDVR